MVDDAVVARRVISEILSDEDGLEVVGTAPNGRIALTKIERLQPDLVTLDIDMPELDGMETLGLIRSDFPGIDTIMVSNLTQRGARVTVDALFLGAADYVTKATQTSSPEAARNHLKDQLIPKIRALYLGRQGGTTPIPDPGLDGRTARRPAVRGRSESSPSAPPPAARTPWRMF